MIEPFIVPDNMKGSRIRAFFTTKALDGSNLTLSQEIGIPPDKIYMPIQKHTNKVYILRDSEEPVIADAVLTRKSNVLIGVAVADCVPILLYDPVRMTVGAVHAGWRGTAQGILSEAIDSMARNFYTKVEDIFIAMGPSIRGCCYTVGFDVIAAIKKSVRLDSETAEGNFVSSKGDAFYLDLVEANKTQAISLGVSEKKIWISPECTFCNSSKFYSYRYAKGTTGRQGGYIGLTG
ncbi:MAG: peptidoglycan editing factor PgeF [Nitrospirae bacterium]|nr:peptidoglycan editing factor PgeF [Nitrospirota bacterium]